MCIPYCTRAYVYINLDTSMCGMYMKMHVSVQTTDSIKKLVLWKYVILSAI
jgi:hypothetical protein